MSQKAIFSALALPHFASGTAPVPSTAAECAKSQQLHFCWPEIVRQGVCQLGLLALAGSEAEQFWGQGKAAGEGTRKGMAAPEEERQ